MAEAALLLVAARTSVRLLPFRMSSRALGERRASPPPTDQLPTDPPPSMEAADAAMRRCRWAIHAAARRLPGTVTCLSEAAAGQLMLRRRRVGATVVFGLAHDDGHGDGHGDGDGAGDGEWANHAWLEARGRVVLGGNDTARYTRMVEYVGAPRPPRPRR